MAKSSIFFFLILTPSVFMVDKQINFILNQNDVFPSSCQGLPALAQEILGWAGPRACTPHPRYLSISPGIIVSQVRSGLNETL